MIDTVFFDLDGTLLDVKNAQNKACELLFFNYNFSEKTEINDFMFFWDKITEKYYADFIKYKSTYSEQRIHRIKELFAHYSVPLPSDNALKIYGCYLKEFERNWKLFPDVKENLKKLTRNFQLGIISNGNLKQQLKKLELTGISQLFSSITTGEETGFNKPDQEIFRIAMSRLMVKPDQCCFVGDNLEFDIYPCIQLNFRKVVFINRSDTTLKDESSFFTIYSLSLLEEIIHR
ncbi:MAG: HAD family hydrolase [Crenarchaeota archaeon]|nr:HAD family hydrolase [Thermoproteota archaeon]